MQVILRRVFDGLHTDQVCVEHSHFLIGRDEDCQLCPASPLISRRHCEINIEDGRVTVRDLASTNGTYVNCQRVEDTRELSTGDMLNVGLACYEVQIVDETATNRKDSRYLKRLFHLFEQWAFPLPSTSCS